MHPMKQSITSSQLNVATHVRVLLIYYMCKIPSSCGCWWNCKGTFILSMSNMVLFDKCIPCSMALWEVEWVA